jgi:hypothetical protein
MVRQMMLPHWELYHHYTSTHEDYSLKNIEILM